MSSVIFSYTMGWDAFGVKTGPVEGESGGRRPGHWFEAGLAKSNRSYCRMCNKTIDQGDLRLAFLMTEGEGYKNTCWCHFDCFWHHREAKKVLHVSELLGYSALPPEQKKRIDDAHAKLRALVSASKSETAASKTNAVKKSPPKTKAPKAKSSAKKASPKATKAPSKKPRAAKPKASPKGKVAAKAAPKKATAKKVAKKAKSAKK